MTVAIPALALAPLWIDGVNLQRVIAYTGVPGWGGLSLVVDPALGWHWLTSAGLPPSSAHSGASLALQDNSRWITLGALAI